MLPPQEFTIQLQHGITGGIMIPIVQAFHEISAQPGDNLEIKSAVLTDGAPSLPAFVPKQISSREKHTASLLEELYGILKSIPTESPEGSEDIYGLDMSINWVSEDFKWNNLAPGGCAYGTSEVKPTEEEKAKFRRAVEIVTEITSEAKPTEEENAKFRHAEEIVTEITSEKKSLGDL